MQKIIDKITENEIKVSDLSETIQNINEESVKILIDNSMYDCLKINHSRIRRYTMMHNRLR